jgi:uracil DNA glycosylase
MKTLKMEKSRYELLKDEFEQQYFINLEKFLAEEKNKGEIIYPS